MYKQQFEMSTNTKSEFYGICVIPPPPEYLLLSGPYLSYKWITLVLMAKIKVDATHKAVSRYR